MANLFNPEKGVISPQLRASSNALEQFLRTYNIPSYLQAPKFGQIKDVMEVVAHLIAGYYIRDDPAGAPPIQEWNSGLVDQFLLKVFLGTDNMGAWDITHGKPSLPAWTAQESPISMSVGLILSDWMTLDARTFRTARYGESAITRPDHQEVFMVFDIDECFGGIPQFEFKCSSLRHVKPSNELLLDQELVSKAQVELVSKWHINERELAVRVNGNLVIHHARLALWLVTLDQEDHDQHTHDHSTDCDLEFEDMREEMYEQRSIMKALGGLMDILRSNQPDMRAS
ncbi:unnamed protein product [Zymoseptoria tritici ST99CH_1A5]|uniref:Uncharacterized protein n=1 Tax=Zymoseptoria tritici ST99CH_1A5 TaxID=1276529 RepID=A0A1Y6LIP5_ZYMTR|nr:unnamed protein product [Zymoseptoria tritici ST99CH_1A5]